MGPERTGMKTEEFFKKRAFRVYGNMEARNYYTVEATGFKISDNVLIFEDGSKDLNNPVIVGVFNFDRITHFA
jgi:hypothetical protein